MKVAVLIACLVAATLAVHQKPQQSILCDVCRFVGKEVNTRILDDETKEEFLEAAREMCTFIPSPWNGKCLDAISKFGSEIVDEAFKTLDLEAFCEEMNFAGHYLCPHNSTAEVFSQLRDGESCSACKDALSMIKMLITSDEMKDLIHLAVNATCSSLGNNVESCEAVVTTTIDEILGNLLPMFNVNALCQFSGACPVPAWMAAHTGAVQCLVCKDVFGILEGVVSSTELDEMLAVGVNETCKLIGFGEESCLAIGNILTSQLITTLKQLVCPGMVCGNLGVCPHASAEVIFQSSAKDNEVCKVCMDGFEIIQGILKADETEDLVHIAVHELCLAIGQVETCTKLIEGVLDPILKQLIFLFDPATLCKSAGACPNLLLVNAEGKLCDLCIDGILEVKNIAADKETEDMLEELTDLICGTLSIPFCKAALNTVVKEALQGLGNLDANSTCATLDACPSFHVDNVDGPICSACSAAINMVINTIVDNAEFHSIVNGGIRQICRLWPSEECVTLLDDFFTTAITITKSYGGLGVCTLVKLC